MTPRAERTDGCAGTCARRLWITLARASSVVWLCLVVPALHVNTTQAAEASDRKSRRQAILIGIDEYQKAAPLRCAGNDVRQLAMTLRERGEYEVLEIVNTARDKPSQSETEAMQARVKDYLARLGGEDDVLVYFSGHGFRDTAGRLYLAQIDCNPADPAPGGVPVAWLREQLAACKAKFKLLLIDACHGGAEKGEDETASVAAKDLAMPFADLASVVTLASSQGNEKSLVWPEKQQSLFSYWVNQGLKGHADQNGNGQVSIDELYEYVFRNVTDIAERHFGRKQTPVRVVRSGTPGVPVVIALSPQTLKGMLEDMAEQLATAMQLRGLSKVGIPEFTVDAGPRELLGGKFGTLGRYCAVELEGALMKKSAQKFEVVQNAALQEVFLTKGIGVKDLRGGAVRELSIGKASVPVLALGTLRSREGRVMTAQCKLVGLEGQQTFGTAGGTSSLNESEWAMLGRSANASVPVPPTVDNPHPDPIGQLDRESEGAHPLLSPDFPYRVQVMVGNDERKGVFRGNDLFVPLRKGEVYWVRIENRDPRVVLMRLLVDGRNTLPEKPRTKDVTVEPKRQPAAELPAQWVNLAEARHWQLDPKGTFGIRGFFKKLGAEGAYLEFTVADAPDSLAGREKYGEQLGLITAAFYAPKGDARRGLITEPGKERQQQIRMYEDPGVGKLLAVVNIRYVDAEALEKEKSLDEKPVATR